MEGIPLNMVKLKDWTENVGKKNKKNIAKVQNVFKLTSESLENYYKYIWLLGRKKKHEEWLKTFVLPWAQEVGRRFLC